MQGKHALYRLAATYLAIIMVMSIGFSMIFYHTTARQLDKRRPDMHGPVMSGQVAFDDLTDFLDRRAEEGKSELVAQLVFINIITLCIGAVLSYLLAEQTLKPITRNMNAQVQFVSDASHELRTPLTAVKASNEVALRDPKLTLAQAKQVIEGNIEDIDRLEQLTSALLNLSNAADIVLEPQVDVQQTVSRALTTVAPHAVARNITVDDRTKRLTVHANAQALEQVLTIILDNAIKYSNDEGLVVVSASAHSKSVIIQIKDNGIGMDETTMKHMFDRFYRADTARTFAGHNGYGLGLAIAQKLIAAQHGTITVTSKLGKGSSLSIKLPRS